jgi:hypothetical protein
VVQPSYALLCGVQGAIVMTPSRPRRVISHRALGLAVPAAAMLVGVGAIQLLTDGAQWLAWLAAIATPLLGAATWWSRTSVQRSRVARQRPKATSRSNSRRRAMRVRYGRCHPVCRVLFSV